MRPTWSQHIHSIDSAWSAVPGRPRISLEGMGTLIWPLPRSLIRDKDLFSGEELGAWERLWMEAGFR